MSNNQVPRHCNATHKVTTLDQDLTRAEALAYMPIPRIDNVAQGFIPASGCGIRAEDK